MHPFRKLRQAGVGVNSGTAREEFMLRIAIIIGSTRPGRKGEEDHHAVPAP
jgi:hypothetical protein